MIRKPDVSWMRTFGYVTQRKRPEIMWPFKRKALPPMPSENSSSESSGEQLSLSEAAYRRQRIQEIAALTEKSLPDAEDLADRWIIHHCIPGEDGAPCYIPHPVWDNEWMLTRDGYQTREEAQEHVVRVGGLFLVPRENG